MRDRRDQPERNWTSSPGGRKGCHRTERDLLRQRKRLCAGDFSAARRERRHRRSGEGKDEVFSRSDGKKCHCPGAADRSANGSAREKGVRPGGIGPKQVRPSVAIGITAAPLKALASLKTGFTPSIVGSSVHKAQSQLGGVTNDLLQKEQSAYAALFKLEEQQAFSRYYIDKALADKDDAERVVTEVLGDAVDVDGRGLERPADHRQRRGHHQTSQ